MKVVLTGGGTGGHIYPALAVAKQLSDDADVDSVLYIGKKEGLEATLVVKNGVPFEGIQFFGMPRKNPFKWLQWLFQLNVAVGQSKKILKRFKPDVVLGTGGYVSAPVLMAAKQLNIPIVIHEPDAHPGLANKMFSKNAHVITAAFEAAKDQMKMGKKTRFFTTGNPIHFENQALSKPEIFEQLGLTQWSVDKPILLVFGGSQGSRSINRAVASIAHQLVFDEGVQVFHIAGNKLYEETVDLLDAELKDHPSYHVLPFCHQMAMLMSISTLCICRSGSVSLSELFASGVPSILVPFPFAAADHQRKNAFYAVSKGASIMIEDNELRGTGLLNQIHDVLVSSVTLTLMKESALALAKPMATQEISALVKKVAFNQSV